MGKQASKHVPRSRTTNDAECFLVNAQFKKTLEEDIWKKTKTGFNLANYNMDQSISELSICLEEKPENNCPLRVHLPPSKNDNDTAKVLNLDQEVEKKEKCEDKKDGEKMESRLNIEEFECGVQFEGSENSKQEWSFTLYDFDGHGKITKEDLASLLKALYDAVGSSIKIPTNGTKTLKLRLTVGQDGSQLPNGQVSPKSKENNKNKDTKKPKESPKVKINNITQAQVKCNNETQGQSCSKNRTHLSTQEQQHLVELVQENMDRNHIKQLRRHHSDCKNGNESTHHKRRHRVQTMVVNNNISSTNPEEKPKESQDRRNYYLDLAGIENNVSKFHPMASSVPTATVHTHCSVNHHRSRSHDVAQNCENVKDTELLGKQLNNARNDHSRSRSFDPQEVTVRSPKGQKVSSSSPYKHGRFRPVSLPTHVPDTVSPHYHRRHRHREKDHDLAMQQVAEWIEREHQYDIDGDKIVIQRHEHHHIHEHHHHHHYHHYYEA